MTKSQNDHTRDSISTTDSNGKSGYYMAYYLDPDDLLKGIQQMRNAGLQIGDVLTPFPVHGLEKAMGLPQSRLSRVAFTGGAIGAILAFGFQTWVFTIDYPLNFGGKPFFSVPSFIPLTFEMAVLFAALFMVAVFFAVNKLIPSINPVVVHDEPATDDRFVVIVKVDTSQTNENIRQTGNIIAAAGGLGITLKTTDNRAVPTHSDTDEDKTGNENQRR